MFVGIVLGLLALGVMVAFSVVLPKASGGEEAAEAVELALPDALPGGYVAADDAASFADSELADRADEIAEQQGASTEYGNEVLPDVLDTAAVTRSYVVNGTDAVFVQVIEADGGAFAPTSLTDPATTGGAGGITMENIDDGVCILTYGSLQAGQPAGEEPVSNQCQLTLDGVTVQLSSDQVSAEDLVALAHDVLDVAV